jgi:restriction system protein
MTTRNGDATTWGIHAGRIGDAERLFLDQRVVALGWAKVGNLAPIGADRESFKVAVARAYPEKKPGAIPNNAGQLFRFVHELAVGDLVVYSSKSTRQVHIGRVSGDYRHAPESSPNFPHQRSIQWLKAVPRTTFSQGALYELGSAMSFFQLKNYADEFRALLEGAAPQPASDDTDATVAVVAEEIENNTRDFILKQLARELKGHPFAHFVAHLLQQLGYVTRVSPPGADGGIDIMAHRDQLGFEPPIIKVQVKSSESTVSEADVKHLFASIAVGEFGLFVALGGFKAPAARFARSKSNLRLVDGEELVRLVLDHYEKFDATYKGLLPLRRVWVPVAIEEGDEST